MSLRACLVFSVFCAACAGAPATIEYVDTVPAHPRIGEIATVKFKLADYRGVPQAGSMVTFSIEGGGNDGVVITPKVAMSLKGSGEVTTQVVAGTGVNGIVVRADAGGGKVALSPQITFAGSAASASQFTFQCGSFAGNGSGGIHAIGVYNEVRDMIAGVKLKCTAHTGDRHGDGVPGANVSFLTEAGTIGPTETTMTDVIGNATILYKSSLPLPHDTDPLVFQWNPDTTCPLADKALCTGEYLVPLWMEPNTWTSNPLGTLLIGTPPYNATNLQEPRRKDPVRRLANGMQPVNNPRDNLVTLIAVTIGEEGFIDKNDNGKFDADEEPIDTTEPFVDSNDNGTHDMDEKYVDTNRNGQWDGKNNAWDSNTLIWRQEKILWTGIPYAAPYVGPGAGMGEFDDYTAPEPVVLGARPLGSSRINCKGGARFELAIADPWFNSMARNGAGDGCKKGATTENVDVPAVAGATGFAYTYPPIGIYSFLVTDNLERDPVPMTMPQSPGCFPPPFGVGTGSVYQDWEVIVVCEFTAAQEEGFKTGIPFGAGGTIVNNLPNVGPTPP